jgi:glycosyltransferase 2 family protein
MKINGKLLISLIFSLFFVVLILYKIDFEKTKEALETANYVYIPIAVLLSVLTNIVRTYRWKFIINPIKKISISSLFSGVAVGYMANNLLPARLGEFIRAYIMGKKEDISKSSTLATIVVERIFDGLTLLFFLVIIALLFPLPLWIEQAGFAAGAFFILLSAFLILLMVKKAAGIRLVKKFIGIVSPRLAIKVGDLLNNFLSGLIIVNHKRNILLAFIFSIIVWLVEASTYYIISVSFGMDLPVYVALLTVVIVNIGILIPSAPGYIGAFEFFCISALGIFAVERSIALSYAIVLHTVLFIPITLIGIFYFWKENLNFSDITNVTKLPAASVENKILN